MPSHSLELLAWSCQWRRGACESARWAYSRSQNAFVCACLLQPLSWHYHSRACIHLWSSRLQSAHPASTSTCPFSLCYHCFQQRFLRILRLFQRMSLSAPILGYRRPLAWQSDLGTSTCRGQLGGSSVERVSWHSLFYLNPCELMKFEIEERRGLFDWACYSWRQSQSQTLYRYWSTSSLENSSRLWPFEVSALMVADCALIGCSLSW